MAAKRLAAFDQVMQIGARIVAARPGNRSSSSSGRGSSAWRALFRLTLPHRVKARPWRPARVGITQSNMSMPRATASTISSRRADAHQVARLVGRQRRQVDVEDAQHHRLRLADGKPADGVALEVHRRQRLGRTRAQVRLDRRPGRCRTAPCPAGRRRRALRALGPAQRQLHGALDLASRRPAARRIRRAASGCRSRAGPGSRSIAPASAHAGSRRYGSGR